MTRSQVFIPANIPTDGLPQTEFFWITATEHPAYRNGNRVRYVCEIPPPIIMDAEIL
jgi:hypothetical protein